jgi:pimeloyl-ACP methyl ester carboxylesterase
MSKFLSSLAVATLLASVALSPGTAAAAEGRVKNVVLVHGAFADGTGWKAVAELLTRDGFKVSVVQEPETSLEDDIRATQRVLDQQDGPVVLVGHSYGGQIITDAGNDPKVKALVYVAALMPEAGDSLLSLVKTMPLPNEDIKSTKDGYLYLDPAKFAADFAADLPRATSAFMAISQVPVSEKAFSTVTTKAAWHDKPSFAIAATQDKALNPDLERWMYKRGGADVTEIKASHAVYMSKPQAVVDVIEKAAKAVR